MKKFDQDILASRESLKGLPYEVPAGYLDGLKKELMKVPASATRDSITRKVIYYAAGAAAVVILFAAGRLFPGRNGHDDFTEEDIFVFSNDVPNTIFYETGEQYADAYVDDDVIEYLIDTGVELEDLEIY